MFSSIMPARCTIDPFALRNLSHAFSACGGLLLVFTGIILFSSFQRPTRSTLYYWLFVGVTFLVSICVFFLAMKTNHDLIVCSFGPADSFSSFQALSIFISSITLILFIIGIGMMIVNRRRKSTQQKAFC